MIRLMNSAMMPVDGIYISKTIDKDLFFRIFKYEYNNNNTRSYIGYRSTVDLIYKNTGILLDINRSKTIVNNDDILLIIKLKYRLSDPGLKRGYIPHEDDHEYKICLYKNLQSTSKIYNIINELDDIINNYKFIFYKK